MWPDTSFDAKPGAESVGPRVNVASRLRKACIALVVVTSALVAVGLVGAREASLLASTRLTSVDIAATDQFFNSSASETAPAAVGVELSRLSFSFESALSLTVCDCRASLTVPLASSAATEATSAALRFAGGSSCAVLTRDHPVVSTVSGTFPVAPSFLAAAL